MSIESTETQNWRGKLTQQARQACELARRIAFDNNQKQLLPLHLLDALMTQEETVIQPVLRKLDVDTEKTKKLIDEIGRQIDRSEVASENDVVISKQLLEAFDTANSLALTRGDTYISNEHLLQALIDTDDIVQRILFGEKKPAKPQTVMDVIAQAASRPQIAVEAAEKTFPALERYTTDLTKLAKEGKLDPVIGRDEEIRRVMEILSRRTKNSPVLIGETGVGKSAVVRGLAHRIALDDVPDTLKGKKILTLEIGAMSTGAANKSDFEQRLKTVTKEVEEAGDIICFINELHTIADEGVSGSGADILKPLLARGQMRLIGAITPKDYRKYIEADASFERNFQSVLIEEPTVEEAISILRGIQEKYEVYHGVRVKDVAVVAAVNLAKRYITDRFLPEKAIGLMDEAASALKLELESSPVELDKAQRRVLQLQIELESLKDETEPKSVRRREVLEEELANRKEALNTLQVSWQEEKALIEDMRHLNAELEQLFILLETAERNADLETSVRLSNSEIPAVQQHMKAVEAKLADGSRKKLLRDEVTEQDIAGVVQKWTGIPVAKLLEAEIEKLANLEDRLSEKVVGQEEAVAAVSNAIRRSRSGLADPRKPVGTFLFLGPTGVGKTFLAETLAQYLFDDEYSLTTIDMSEYMEAHSVSRLVGAPPGYTGYDEGGQLTEAVRRRPYSVVLYDEAEKAHPQVFNIFLQVFDQGRLTDAQGRKVDFRNTVNILTSNLGADIIQEAGRLGMDWDEVKVAVLEVTRKSFRPEFLNRIDEILVFRGLRQEDIMRIAGIQLNDLGKRLREQDISFSVDDAAKARLATIGFDPMYGARPLKRAVQKYVVDPLASMLIKGEIKTGDQIAMKLEGENFTFSK